MVGVKETLCSSCGHLQVCSIKHTFLLVQEKIDRLSIITDDGGTLRVIDIPHFSTSLKCTHWVPNVKIRRGGLTMNKQYPLYLCDRRACKHCSPECRHTTDITHAKNFELGIDGVTMVEKVYNMDCNEIILMRWKSDSSENL